MNPVQIIARKRDGRELTRAEINFFVQGFATGRIPNYQMSALAMAVYLKGMTADETAALTEEMLSSGRVLSWNRAAAANAADKRFADAAPRLEVHAQVGGDHEPPSATSTLAIPGAEEDEFLSDLDARDTVDLGEESPASSTMLLDGSINPLSESTGGRDTVDLDTISPAMSPVPFVAAGPVVDKHSTGGLGDKTSLILAPLLACCGLRVPMISGRGLGATGGTLDKLESIPGFRTDLSLDEIRTTTDRVGCVITGATADLVPADRKLYSLRDVTATVASVPLMSASIMSKKLAEGLDALVLDVKWGSGAFMKTLPLARKLAESMVETGRRRGMKTIALLTNMDQPLGRMIGNTLEVDEVVETLAGYGPTDLWSLTCELGMELLVAVGVTETPEEARALLESHVRSGRALDKFREMVAAQGGELDAPRPRTSFQFDLRATRSGYVGKMNAETLGLAVVELGGGRRALAEAIDHSVGLEMMVRIGDRVQTGQSLIRIHCRDSQVDSMKSLLKTAITIRQQPTEPPSLIAERIC